LPLISYFFSKTVGYFCPTLSFHVRTLILIQVLF